MNLMGRTLTLGRRIKGGGRLQRLTDVIIGKKMKKQKGKIRYVNLTTSITGNRHPSRSDNIIISRVMKDVVLQSKKIIFGGAIGVDTVALESAIKWRHFLNKPVRLIVIVPNTLSSQPRETWVTSHKADRIIELGNDGPNRFRIRNTAMVRRSDVLVAFWNGQKRSGTYMTMNIARRMKKPVKVIRITGSD